MLPAKLLRAFTLTLATISKIWKDTTKEAKSAVATHWWYATIALRRISGVQVRTAPCHIALDWYGDRDARCGGPPPVQEAVVLHQPPPFAHLIFAPLPTSTCPAKTLASSLPPSSTSDPILSTSSTSSRLVPFGATPSPPGPSTSNGLKPCEATSLLSIPSPSPAALHPSLISTDLVLFNAQPEWTPTIENKPFGPDITIISYGIVLAVSIFVLQYCCRMIPVAAIAGYSRRLLARALMTLAELIVEAEAPPPPLPLLNFVNPNDAEDLHHRVAADGNVELVDGVDVGAQEDAVGRIADSDDEYDLNELEEVEVEAAVLGGGWVGGAAQEDVVDRMEDVRTEDAATGLEELKIEESEEPVLGVGRDLELDGVAGSIDKSANRPSTLSFHDPSSSAHSTPLATTALPPLDTNDYEPLDPGVFNAWLDDEPDVEVRVDSQTLQEAAGVAHPDPQSDADSSGGDAARATGNADRGVEVVEAVEAKVRPAWRPRVRLRPASSLRRVWNPAVRLVSSAVRAVGLEPDIPAPTVVTVEGLTVLVERPRVRIPNVVARSAATAGLALSPNAATVPAPPMHARLLEVTTNEGIAATPLRRPPVGNPSVRRARASLPVRAPVSPSPFTRLVPPANLVASSDLSTSTTAPPSPPARHDHPLRYPHLFSSTSPPPHNLRRAPSRG
ncbi:hypothetical protein C8R46DRAFT_292151 [Mycena filopes]|nr:hypothetical protein C8R46DRAFT_292151 [Mycena filopes]